jgi:hypothetical protein
MNNEKIESYLINLGLTFETIEQKTWVINDEEKGLENIFITAEEPLIIIRVNVMDIPEMNKESLFETLLRLNASDLIHGAYALDGDNIIITDTLRYETVDLEEFQASLDAIGLALAQHYETLIQYRKPGGRRT